MLDMPSTVRLPKHDACSDDVLSYTAPSHIATIPLVLVATSGPKPAVLPEYTFVDAAVTTTPPLPLPEPSISTPTSTTPSSLAVPSTNSTPPPPAGATPSTLEPVINSEHAAHGAQYTPPPLPPLTTLSLTDMLRNDTVIASAVTLVVLPLDVNAKLPPATPALQPDHTPPSISTLTTSLASIAPPAVVALLFTNNDSTTAAECSPRRHTPPPLPPRLPTNTLLDNTRLDAPVTDKPPPHATPTPFANTLLSMLTTVLSAETAPPCVAHPRSNPQFDTTSRDIAVVHAAGRLPSAVVVVLALVSMLHACVVATTTAPPTVALTLP